MWVYSGSLVKVGFKMAMIYNETLWKFEILMLKGKYLISPSPRVNGGIIGVLLGSSTTSGVAILWIGIKVRS